MDDEVDLVIQVPTDSSVDRSLREHPPGAVASGRAVVEHLPAGDDGRLVAPAAGEVVLSVLSPAALARESDEVRRLIGQAENTGEPLVVVVQAAEELRDDELTGVIAAAGQTHRVVILRIMSGS